MDDDAPLASEITTGPQKRARADTGVAGDEPRQANGDNGENQDRSSDGSDGSPSPGEREGSPDDFEEIRPKTKRSLDDEGTSDVPNKSVERLIEVVIGDGKHISQAVKRWVERHERNPKPAIIELLMMLFEACRAKFHIKEVFLDETDVDDVVVALVSIARKVKLKIIGVQKRRNSRISRRILFHFGTIWLLSSRMGHYLIRNRLTSAWTI